MFDTHEARLETLDTFVRDQEDVDFHGFADGTDLLEHFFEAREMDWTNDALWRKWIDAADEAQDAWERNVAAYRGF